MADNNLKYVINGKPVRQQLTAAQYHYFYGRVRAGESPDFVFYQAKKFKRTNGRIFGEKYYDDACYENKLKKEISFFTKEIKRLQWKHKRKFGEEYQFCVPIPIKASQELESVMLATRCGILWKERGKNDRSNFSWACLRFKLYCRYISGKA